MPEKTEKKSSTTDLEHTKKRLEMLDKRLDNIDSQVTALVERVMRQPVTIEVTCPKCGTVVQIMLTSTTRTTGKG
jgi:tetrahydromethanopterin S-methyltransferase subunit G